MALVATTYEVWLHDLLGRPVLQIARFSTLDAARTINTGGSLVLTLPAEVLLNADAPGLSPQTLITDIAYWWIVAYRTIGNVRKLVLNTVWLILKPERYLDANGNKFIKLTCVDAMLAFLGPSTRIIDYYSGSAQSDKTDYADDMIKGVMRDNYVTATDSARDIPSAYLSVADNVSKSTRIGKSMAWRDVLPVLQEITQSVNKQVVDPPGAPVLAPSVPGTLVPDTYTYAVTAVVNGETTPSASTSIALIAGQGGVTLTWAAVTNASTYKVYGRSTPGLLSDVGNVLTFTDDGSLTPGASPPASNQSFSLLDNPNKLFFDVLVVDTNPLSFLFQTFIGQLGNDHSQTGDGGVEFSPTLGNLLNPDVYADYTGEINAVTAGGQGTDSAQTVVRLIDTTRATKSWISRREGYVNATNVSATDANQIGKLLDAAGQLLTAGKPKIVFTGDIVDTDVAALDVHYGYGDKVIGTFDSDSYDCWINNLSVSLSGGIEKVSGKLSNAI